MTAFEIANSQNYWTAASALAAWMLGVTSLFLNGVGLYFIWGQLKANRQALVAATLSAEAAADAARLAHFTDRPWIKFRVRRAFVGMSASTPDMVSCQIDYTYENIGKAPAVQVGVVFKPIAVTAQTLDAWKDQIRSLLESAPHSPQALFPGEVVELGLSTNFDFPRTGDERWGFGIYVIAAVVYKAHATGQTHATPLALALQIANPPADRDYRLFRGTWYHEFLVIPIHESQPDPT